MLEAYAGLAQVLASTADWQATPWLPTEPTDQEVQYRPVSLAQVCARAFHRLLEERLVLRRSATRRDVGAVDGVMHDQGFEGAANSAQSEVPAHQVATGDLQQCLSHGFEVAGQGAVQHEATPRANLFHEIRSAPAQAHPQVGQ